MGIARSSWPHFYLFLIHIPSTARSTMAGQFFLVLTGACQFGHGVGGFTTNFIHSTPP